MRDYTTPSWHIIYGVFDGKELIYVGSSNRSIGKLEYNHRNWKTLTDRDGHPYKGTAFRKALVKYGDEWEFKVLLSRYCSRDEAEQFEEDAISLTQPQYNKDLTPHQTSIRRGRIEE